LQVAQKPVVYISYFAAFALFLLLLFTGKNMIKVLNLTKSFGSQDILESVSFSINEGERIGLVGRNGHGKTTIFRMLIGEEQPDSGEIVIPKNYSIGYVTQHIGFSRDTVLEEGCLGLPEHMKEDQWRVEKILFGLGFGPGDMKRHPSEFSGGYQVRLNLAKVLSAEPHMLLLDEPTNYLDVVSIRWLSRFLRQWKGELILITHDRSFMDGIITHVVGIHRKKIRKITGTTDKYYEQLLREEEIHEKTRLNDEKKRKEVEQFITRFRAKARLAGLVQSRVKAMEKQGRLERLEKIESLDFSFTYKQYPAKTAMHVKDLSFAYDPSSPLIQNLSFTVGKSDRICVIGKNGRGKTTLLKLLSGDLSPDRGEILTHPESSRGYYAQTNALNLNENITIEEELMAAGCERQRARDICGAMMFEGDNALKKIKVLSGGEKSRVLLGKILAAPSNLLLLDEPTNHLDMESCDAFLAAVDDFDGAAIIVTHNEMFLNTLANRFIVFQGGGVSLFEGTYQSFLEKIGWEDEVDTLKKEQLSQTEGTAEPINKKELRKLRAAVLTRRTKELKPLEERSAAIEKDLMKLETTQKEINEAIIAASATGSGQEIQRLSKELHNVQSGIESLYDEYARITDSIDEKGKQFDRELEELGE